MMDGSRMAYARRGGRRSWSIDANLAAPAEASTIETIARGAQAVGWYGPDAAIGNLLSPQASGFDVAPYRTTDTGLVQLPDGSTAREVSRTAPGAVYVGGPENGPGVETVPVRPGSSVTLGVWASGTFQPIALWRNSAGENLTTSSGATSTGGASLSWRSHTFLPPPGAVTVGFYTATSQRMARPSISWGGVAADELGTGCPAALIHDSMHRSVSIRPGVNYADLSYAVTEVG